MKNKILTFVIALIFICPLLTGPLTALAEKTEQTNISVDYQLVSAFSTEKEYVDYLNELVTELNAAPNDAAKAELVTYVETAVSALASISLEAGSNQFIISGEDLGDGIAVAESTRDNLERILSEHDITVNKIIDISFCIEGTGFDLSEPGQVTFASDVPENMGSAQSLRLLLGDNRHSIVVSADSLSGIISECGSLVIRFRRTDFRQYAISFPDADGAVIEKLPEAVTFTLPAESTLATVLATYSEGVDNWGGQYDASNGAIAFSTRYSGTYEVLEDKITISDIGGLPAEDRSVIAFMVSKGYFTLAGSLFSPDRPLTKYDFTAALVKMFFALDRDSATSFSDVPPDSAYYAYVSSAEAEKIAKGDGSGRFIGDGNISVQEVVALCSRTLAEKKGYSYPEDPEAYLQFSDSADIDEWARQDVALAVRENLIPSEGALDPDGEVTRAESAQILYRLFMLLYETSPIAFDMNSGQMATVGDKDANDVSGEDDGPSMRSVLDVVIKILVAAAVIALLVCLYLLFGRKRLQKKRRR